jgi:hypothetical protein
MKLLFLFFLISFSKAGFAWGPTGHRVVGDIAEAYLSKNATKEIKKIISNEPLARISTWPDEIKSDPNKYSYTFNWHYTDWPDDQENYDENKSSGLLLKKIDENLGILKSGTSSKQEKQFALKFLVHLVGDLHMPLHVGDGKDRGGNNCHVYFHEQLTNLHAVWDDKMIEFSKLSFTELSNILKKIYTKQEISHWQSGKILDWARESKELRSKVYPDVQKLYCVQKLPENNENIPKLSYDYSFRFMSELEKRLFQAGIRLAYLLNQVYK